MKKVFKIKKFYILLFILFFYIFFTCSSSTYSNELLDNGVKVEPDTELTYYLDVTYDGVDKFGVQSSDTVLADITSKDINVTDQLPAGLTFVKFVGSSGDQIGAAKRDGTDGVCLGYVEGGYNGLKYDANTRTVSFKVINMQAGCKVTVGIVTKTPALIDDPDTTGIVETRRDFYNTADGTEGDQAIKSNTVHVWMGQESGNLYAVRYQYSGIVPTNAPILPTSDNEFEKYSKGSIVSVASPIEIDGYDFVWESNDVIVSNGTFTMPDNIVTFTGRFIEKNKYDVIYKINGDVPDGYTLPGGGIKSYHEGSVVTLDTLKNGDVVNGYIFKGWTTNDVVINGDEFTMPTKNVMFTGSFEQIKYNVSYAFQGSILPPDSSNYLPETKSYAPGDVVNLESDIENIGRYEFVGWYASDTFVMPDEDVVIYGEWVLRTGYFEPTFTVTFDDTCAEWEKYNGNCYFSPEDYRYAYVRITNDTPVVMKNVLIKLDTNANSINKSDSSISYSRLETGLYEIASLPINASVEFRIVIKIGYDDGHQQYNAELLGALADDNYVLVNKDYSKVIDYYVKSTINLSNKLKGLSRESFNRYTFKTDKYRYNALLSDNTSTYLYLPPGTYTVTQLKKQDYVFNSIDGGVITENGGQFTIPEDSQVDEYIITFNNSVVNEKWYRTWSRVRLYPFIKVDD